MSKARDMINAHLYPVLAVFSVVYFGIQIAPIAREARMKNACAEYRSERWENNSTKRGALARGVVDCNGG